MTNSLKTIGKWWFNGILWDVPSGNDLQFPVKMTITISEFSHEQMSFSIAMFVYQRVIDGKSIIMMV